MEKKQLNLSEIKAGDIVNIRFRITDFIFTDFTDVNNCPLARAVKRTFNAKSVKVTVSSVNLYRTRADIVMGFTIQRMRKVRREKLRSLLFLAKKPIVTLSFNTDYNDVYRKVGI